MGLQILELEEWAVIYHTLILELAYQGLKILKEICTHTYKVDLRPLLQQCMGIYKLRKVGSSIRLKIKKGLRILYSTILSLY